MIECKLTLPYFDDKGIELSKEHAELRDILIRRYGLVERINSIIMYRDTESQNFNYLQAFEYKIHCPLVDKDDFIRISKVYGRKCRLKFVRPSFAPVAIEDIDLVDLKDKDNWQAFANERLAERQRVNCPWPEKGVK